MGPKLRSAGFLQGCAEPGFLAEKGFISSQIAIFPCIYNESYVICCFVDFEHYPSSLTNHPPESLLGPAKRRRGAPARLSQTSLSQTVNPHSSHRDRESKRT
jgi:hypothetical protein